MSLLAIALAGWLVVACVTAGARPDASRLAAAKCGACHLIPQPGALDDARFDKVMEKHRRRAPLSEEQKVMLREYLSGQENGSHSTGNDKDTSL